MCYIPPRSQNMFFKHNDITRAVYNFTIFEWTTMNKKYLDNIFIYSFAIDGK